MVILLFCTGKSFRGLWPHDRNRHTRLSSALSPGKRTAPTCWHTRAARVTATMSNEETDTKERIAAIPRSASVLGVDSAGRVHLFAHHPTEIWVVDDSGTECLHYLTTSKPLSEWVDFVEQKCGWQRRHRIELDAGERLLDPEPAPPTRAEVLS